MKKTHLTWEDVTQRLQALLEQTGGKPVWGIPRGGAIVAGLTGAATDNHEDAAFIVRHLRLWRNP